VDNLFQFKTVHKLFKGSQDLSDLKRKVPHFNVDYGHRHQNVCKVSYICWMEASTVRCMAKH